MSSQTAAPSSPLAALRAALFRRVGFWRALVEMLVLVNGITLLFYPVHRLLSSPWSELIGYLSLSLYAFAAWKLEPGSGGRWRRMGRVGLWLLIFGLLSGVIGWALLRLLPWKGDYFGASIDAMRLGFATSVISVAYVIVSLFLPVRLLLALWALGRRRLRWQLTFSYLLIGILTNIFLPLALFAYIGVVSLSAAPTMFPPAELAPALADALAPTLRARTASAELDAVLDGLLDGSTRLPLPPDADLAAFSNLARGGVRSLTLLGADGLVIASSGEEALPLGEPLPADDRADLRLVLDAAATGGCREGNPASGPLADIAACVMVGEDGAPIATLLVESNLDGAAQLGAAFGRIVSVTLLGFSLTLNVAFLVVLAIAPIALGVGYFLARRLTHRIESLTAATAGVAAGDLERRVPIESHDEIGRLGDNFNAMASQLAERERALADTAARAEALLRANKRLVADVSHELRNPLATLRGYLEALELTHGAALPAGDLRVIQGETDRLTALVDDLFTLARAEAQQLPLSLGPVDAGALVERLADALAPLARRDREIALVCQVEEGTLQANADAVRLEQVLRNLIQNALRHTPPGGIIALAAAPGPAATVTIAVADTGTGIEADDLPHVFERFYRGDSSRARETGGAGLGLSLVRELVTAMGGSVGVESTPGRGSRFTVTLKAV